MAINAKGIFESPFIHRLLKSLNDGLMFFRKRFNLSELAIKITGEEDCCTDGETIYLGKESPLFEGLKAKEKLAAIYGVILHEMGHLLYTSFTTLYVSRAAIYAGEFYPKKPDRFYLVEDYLEKGEKERSRAYTWYKHLQNILEDGRIECALLYGPCGAFRMYAAGLNLVRSLQWDLCPDIGESIKDINAADDKKKAGLQYDAVFDFCLSMAKYGEVKGEISEIKEEKIFQDFMKAAPYIASAVSAETTEEFQINLNEVFCLLFKYVKPYLDNIRDDEDQPQKGEKKDSGKSDGKGGGNSSPKSSSAADKPLREKEKSLGINRLQDDSKQAKKVEEKTQNAKKELSDNMREKSRPANGNDGQDSKDSKSGNSDSLPKHRNDEVNNPFAGQTIFTKEDKEIINGIDLDEISRIVSEEDKESIKRENRQKELSPDSVNPGDANKNVSWHINIVPDAKESAWQMYDEFAPFVDKANEAAERLRDILRAEPRKIYETGHFYGHRLNRHRFYDPAMRYFDRKIDIPAPPTLSVAILVDQSGSMASNNKIKWVKAMTIMLYEMCRILEIPYAVFGHNASGGQVYIDSYCYFDDNDEASKYRLLKIDTNRANRDGAALRYVSDKLAKQSTSRKILFIISDGRPNDAGYSDDVAMADIQGCVAEYERVGVKTLACAIASDKEAIEGIYGSHRFLNISCLEELPEIITDIVERNI